LKILLNQKKISSLEQNLSEKGMRILMVLERDFPPDLRVENEIKSLLKYGHQVFLACYTFGKLAIVEDWHGCRVFKQPITPFIYKSSVGALRLPFYFRFWRHAVLRLCDALAPEAVHIHDLPLASIGALCKEKFGMKFVLDLHENWPAFLCISKHANTFLGKLLSSNKQWERYELESCHTADQVIVVIEEAKERLVELGIETKKINVVANYPVLEDFKEIEKKKSTGGQVIMLYAGGIGEHRGLQYVISAMPEILRHHPKVVLKILGEGNYKTSLERQVQTLGVENSVVFTGQVSYHRVLEELAMTDIALIPHIKSEHTDSTIPHKLFQYMYSGIPVIASNCKPIERIIKESGAGYVYSWDSPGEFAANVHKLISANDIDQQHSRQMVETNFTWDMAAQNLLKIYGS
jgi:glycosyltransferase involved in cell wall biosynthesis